MKPGEMMFPKRPRKKKRKKHKPSILQIKDGRCYLCMMNEDYRVYPVVHKHHIFGGMSNRDISEAYGLYCYLCPDHHEFSRAAVHQNAENMAILRKIAEEQFEKIYSEEKFYELFRRFYK